MFKVNLLYSLRAGYVARNPKFVKSWAATHANKLQSLMKTGAKRHLVCFNMLYQKPDNAKDMVTPKESIEQIRFRCPLAQRHWNSLSTTPEALPTELMVITHKNSAKHFKILATSRTGTNDFNIAPQNVKDAGII
jgi:hypothetical protein